jgi:ribosomal protein S18 acetylase RimI-like enzyme
MIPGDIYLGENDIEESDVVAVNQLLKQLNPALPAVNWDKVRDVMRTATIITLRDSSKYNTLMGMGTLAPIHKLTHFCGTIEDVVLNQNYRGRGLGKAMMNALVGKSIILKMRFVDLTSNPKREAANKLYESLGFKKKETNSYRLFNS